jgi:cysteine-rich repeat protein
MMRRVAMAFMGMLGLGACPDDPSAGTEGDSTGETSTSTTTAGTSTSSTTEPGTTSSSSAGSSDTGPVVGCGNGELEEGEQCDDGNQIDDDACSNDCIPSCGLRWEFQAAEDVLIDMVAPTADGNARVGGFSMGAGAPLLYHELLDDEGVSLESESFDVGFVEAPNVPWIAAVGTRGSFLFANYDLGNGGGARVAAFDDGPTVGWDVEPEPALIDEPFDRGIDLTDDGDVVIAAAVDVADGDDDIWVARLASADGSTMWTGTHSGPLVGGFSTDDGGPVAVAGDGSVYVLGLVREDLGLTDATLVKFADGGGAPLWTQVIHEDAGAEEVSTIDADADADANVLVSVMTLVGATRRVEISLLDPDGAVQWAFTTEDLEIDPALEVEPDMVAAPLVGFAPDGSITVAGTVDGGVAGLDLLVFRLSAQGEQLCHALHQVAELEGDRAPTHLAVMPDGGALVAGAGAGSERSIEWVARFRP